MFNVYLRRPDWFLGVDASLELLAAIIAFSVAFASFRVYRMTSGKKYAIFTLSFAMLTMSFLMRALTDFVLEELLLKVPDSLTGTIFFVGYVAHIFLALVSYLMLVIISLRIKDRKIISLLSLILIPSLLISGSYFLSFYGLSLILLSFITFAYYINYRNVCVGSACLVFLAFLLLTLAQAQFLLDAVLSHFYVTAHITQAAGFFVLLLALIRTMKK